MLYWKSHFSFPRPFLFLHIFGKCKSIKVLSFVTAEHNFPIKHLQLRFELWVLNQIIIPQCTHKALGNLYMKWKFVWCGKLTHAQLITGLNYLCELIYSISVRLWNRLFSFCSALANICIEIYVQIRYMLWKYYVEI